MKKQNIKSKKGFTIIEVVLVLAIAGLIFLMVFVALPALQRSQRDSQRRQDYSNLQAAVISSAVNNSGTVGDIDKLALNKDGTTPTGKTYSVQKTKSTDTFPTKLPTLSDDGKVYVYIKAECSDGKPVRNDTTNVNSFVIYGFLETGSYCQTGSLK